MLIHWKTTPWPLFALLAALASAEAPAGRPAVPAWVENTALEMRVLPVPSANIDPEARPAIDATSGEVFDSPDYQSMLLLPSALDVAYVLSLQTGEVQAYARDAVLTADGRLRKPEGEPLHAATPFVIDKTGLIQFDDAKQRITVEPAPPIIGQISRAELQSRHPGYARRASVYKPDAGAVRALAAVRGSTEIVVCFGTWCLTCRHHLPALLATLDAAKNPALHVTLIGLDENMSEPKDEIERYRILTTPTIVVISEGQELGRIEEDPQASMEVDLAEILTGYRATGQ